MKRVLVAGAGISGLSLAFELDRLGIETVVVESEARAGGKIETDHRAGYLCERGPASYLDRHGSVAPLARALGIAERVLPASAAGERRLVVAGGLLHDTPLDASAFVRSRLLPVGAKLRMLGDLVLPRGPAARGQEESVLRFGRRRLGALAGQRLLQPLVSGLYAGDPAQVSLPAAFPHVAGLERQYRSLMLGMRAEAKQARVRRAAGAEVPVLSSFTGGLAELTDALARALGERLRLATRLGRIQRSGPGFRVGLEHAGQTAELDADALVLALPAHAATALVAPLEPGMAGLLDAIPYVPVTLVHLGYPQGALPSPVRAYGFFVPEAEPLRILGAIFASELFRGRAPEGHCLITVRTGGARHREAMAMPGEELAALAHAELGGLLGLTAPPSFIHLARHERALPQYTLGHQERVAALAAGERRLPGLYLHGNAYHNAGVPELVSRSGKLAQRIALEAGMGTPPGSPR
jgi:oxygen-dependent protoporphyrinogen oxidase